MNGVNDLYINQTDGTELKAAPNEINPSEFTYTYCTISHYDSLISHAQNGQMAQFWSSQHAENTGQENAGLEFGGQLCVMLHRQRYE